MNTGGALGYGRSSIRFIDFFQHRGTEDTEFHRGEMIICNFFFAKSFGDWKNNCIFALNITPLYWER